MIAVNYSELRNKLKDYCDRAIDNLETVLVTRKNDRNVVMISLEEYNNLLENQYIMSNDKYYKELIKRSEEVRDITKLKEVNIE